MSGDRKKKPVERDGPSWKERLRAKILELANPEPEDAYEPDSPESFQLSTRIHLLPKSWQQPAKELVKDCEDRELSAGEIHLELDRLQSLYLDFSRKGFPEWKRAGGRSTEATERWCDAILAIANPNDPTAFGEAAKRAEKAAFAAIRGEEITDTDFKSLKGCLWVGREREGRPHPPLLKNIRSAAAGRWERRSAAPDG